MRENGLMRIARPQILAAEQSGVVRFAFQNYWYAVFPIAVLLLFPSPWMSAGFVLALGLFAMRWMATGHWIPKTKSNLSILILLAMTAAGFSLSSAPDLGMLTAGQVVASVCFFFVLADQLRSSADLWRTAVLVVFLGLIIALITPLTVDLSQVPSPGLILYTRLLPSLPEKNNPNILAGALAPLVPIALALVRQKNRRWQMFGVLALIPIVSVLFLLESRGALFALGIGLAIWLTLYRRWFLPLIPLALIAVLTVNQSLNGPSPADLLFGKIGTPKGGTYNERHEMWIQAVYLIQLSPFFGIGLGAYPRVAPYTWPYSPAQPNLVIANHAHNLFLQIALDTGVLGVAAFCVLLLISIRSLWRAYRTGVERDLAIGILSAFAVLIVHGLGDTIFWGTAKACVILWVLLCLAVSFDKVDKVM